ncbi:MAG TPA: hypothetical protein VGM84_28495 [Steroidobacteraceae bacterium]|jgi:hypothetical protein
MKALVVSLAAVVLTACAAPPTVIVPKAVGPQHVHRPTEGELLVYSATYVGIGEAGLYPVHTDYTVSDTSGKELERIANRSGPFASRPAPVDLPPGQYQVKALLQGSGYVVVPVVIEVGRQTVLDLDGTALPQNVRSEEFVRLPDGRVIGWNAQVSAH